MTGNGRYGFWARADLKLGRIWSRIGGITFLLVGLVAMFSMLGTEGFAISTHWPGLLIASLFFIASWACFRSKAGFLETLSEMPERGGSNNS